jgi:hypothetical protein
MDTGPWTNFLFVCSVLKYGEEGVPLTYDFVFIN